MPRRFRPGEFVVYRKTKQSTHPGPRAKDVSPAQEGDSYSYTVDKFWIVKEVGGDNLLLIRTRTGKTHEINPDDPNLRRPRIWERLIYRKRFAQLREGEE